MSDDEWVRVAMSDDTLVVQLLLKLNRTEEKPKPPQQSTVAAGLRPPLKWTVRQRRSRQLMPRKKCVRASPTTPLSWSGGTSGSGCGGGGGGGGGLAAAVSDVYEESSDLPAWKSGEMSRSKVAVTSATPSTKRSRRKKTLAELKEEESLLLKERKNLKNQLASLRMNLEQQRSENGNLKRIKLDFLSRKMPDEVMFSPKCEQSNFDQLQKIKAASDPTIRTGSNNNATLETTAPNVSFQIKEAVEAREASFMLPDLNLPVENDLGAGVLYGLS